MGQIERLSEFEAAAIQSFAKIAFEVAMRRAMVVWAIVTRHMMGHCSPDFDR